MLADTPESEIIRIIGVVEKVQSLQMLQCGFDVLFIGKLRKFGLEIHAAVCSARQKSTGLFQKQFTKIDIHALLFILWGTL